MPKPQKLPSGKWRIRYVDHDGRRLSETFLTEAAARSAARRKGVEADDVRSGRAQPKSSLTVKEAAVEWLKTRPELRRKQNASHLNNHLLPFLGSVQLSAVNDVLVRRLINHLESKPRKRTGERNQSGSPLSPNTVNNCLITLRKLLNDHGHSIRIRYKVPTNTYVWLREPKDVKAFLSACSPAWFKVASALALYAGLRKGEIAGLLREKVDFKNGVIYVDRSYEGPTKGKRVRYVPISSELSIILSSWMQQKKGSLVVTGYGDSIIHETDLSDLAHRACKAAGVQRVNFHQLRHTFASHLALKVGPAILQALLGHSDPKTTMRYAHLDQNSIVRDPRVHLSFEMDTPGTRSETESEKTEKPE